MINEEGHEREMGPGEKVKGKGKEVAPRLLTGTVFRQRGRKGRGQEEIASSAILRKEDK